MYLMIDCAGRCGGERVSAYGLVVRCNGRICHMEAGPVCAGPFATPDVAGLAAPARGLAWAKAQPVPEAGVLTLETDWSRADAILPDGALPRGLRTLARFVRRCIDRLSASGWAVCVRQVDTPRVKVACRLCEEACRAWSTSPGAPLRLLAFVRALKEPARPIPAVPPARAPVRKVPAWEFAAPEVAATAAAQEEWTVICDGGYRATGVDAGAAVFGLLVRTGMALVHSAGGVLGTGSSSFEAECGALEAALRWAESAAIGPGARVEFRCDCQAVLLALNGYGRPGRHRTGSTLRSLAERVVLQLRERACQVVLKWVPRKLVAEADRLCRQAYLRPADRKPVDLAPDNEAK